MFCTETCFERYAPRQDANAVTPVSVPPTGVISDFVMSATPPHLCRYQISVSHAIDVTSSSP